MKIIKVMLPALALLFAMQASAQIIFTPPPPRDAPVLKSPATGTLIYNYAAPAQAFVWEQPPFVPSTASPAPTHYLFCLRRAGDPACSHGTADFNLLPGQIPSTVITVPPFVLVRGYRYTYTPTLPDSKLDVPVSWQVAGCTSNFNTSCKFSVATPLLISTQDLKATNTTGSISGNQYRLAAEAMNLGSRDSREFTAVIEAWETMIDPDTLLCAKDPNHRDFKDHTDWYVIDKKGVATLIGSLQIDAMTGKYIANDVVGIYQPNSTFNWSSVTVPMQVLPPTAGNPRPRSSVIGNFLLINVPVRPRAITAKVTLDVGNQWAEPDETNNVLAECEIVN